MRAPLTGPKKTRKRGTGDLLRRWEPLAKRREFIRLLAGAAAWASIAVAQQREVGLPLIGALWPGRPSAPITVSVLQALRHVRVVGAAEGSAGADRVEASHDRCRLQGAQAGDRVRPGEHQMQDATAKVVLGHVVFCAQGGRRVLPERLSTSRRTERHRLIAERWCSPKF